MLIMPDTVIHVPSISEVLHHILENQVTGSIRSFPHGSAVGINGLGPFHLKDSINTSARGGGRALLSGLTLFMETLHLLCSPLIGAILIALSDLYMYMYSMHITLVATTVSQKEP